ncbi:MAG TPA: hypothetical protein VMU05_19675 [Dongiaceae bacterium]|nr:hypothetical protein [Dongiaceae bacterium]
MSTDRTKPDVLVTRDVSSSAQQVPDFRMAPAATESEPWRILPRAKSDQDKGLIVIGPDGAERTIVSLDGRLALEPMCYAIRSYVVARDSKNSDSVHPVGYTTCIPASRYQLRTADYRVTR